MHLSQHAWLRHQRALLSATARRLSSLARGSFNQRFKQGMLPGQEEPVVPIKGAFGQQFLNGANIRSNFTIISFNRVFASLIAGLATGVLGVTGWGGFVYYFLVHALVGLPLYLKAKCQPTEYLQSGRSLWVDEVLTSTSLLTFILFWTLTHNFVHLF